MIKRLSYLIISLLIITIIAIVSYQEIKRRNVINLAYMSDSKYLPYVMVSIQSAIENKNPSTEYNVHIIAKDFSKENEEKIRQMNQNKVRIKLYSAEDTNLDKTHLGRFSSFAISLQKLFIPNYLKELDKVLYLDADTLVQEDLAAVYHTDISDKYIAASKDGLMYQYPHHIEELGLSWRNFYFNSGVMLLNLNKMRQDGIIRKAIIYFNTHNDVFGDQDVLNVIVGKDVIPLSYRYNCNSTFFEEKDAEFLSDFFGETIPTPSQKVYENAAILHFAGHKPWTQWFTHLTLKQQWQRYKDIVSTKYNITF